MKKLLLIKTLTLFSLPIFASSVQVKNCVSINKQKFCFPENKSFYESLKDKGQGSKNKTCFKNFINQRLMKIKLKEHDLLFFQSQLNAGLGIKVVFSSKTKVPKLNIDGVLQKRRGTLILPDLGKQWCRVDIQQKVASRAEKVVNEFYFDHSMIASIPQILFESRNGVEFESSFCPSTQGLKTKIVGHQRHDTISPDQCFPEKLEGVLKEINALETVNCDLYAEAFNQVMLESRGGCTEESGKKKCGDISLSDNAEVNAQICRTIDKAVKELKLKADHLNQFCSLGGSVVDDSNLSRLQFVRNGHFLDLPWLMERFGMRVDPISLENTLRIFEVSEQENIPTDILTTLSRFSVFSAKSNVDMISFQLKSIMEMIRLYKEGSSNGERQFSFEGYYEDGEGNVFDPEGNMVTDENTLEAYLESVDGQKNDPDASGDDQPEDPGELGSPSDDEESGDEDDSPQDDDTDKEDEDDSPQDDDTDEEDEDDSPQDDDADEEDAEDADDSPQEDDTDEEDDDSNENWKE